MNEQQMDTLKRGGNEDDDDIDSNDGLCREDWGSKSGGGAVRR